MPSLRRIRDPTTAARFGQRRHSPIDIARHQRAPAEPEVRQRDRPSVPDGAAATHPFLCPGRRIPGIDHGHRQTEPDEQASRLDGVVDLVHDGERTTPELERLIATAEIRRDGGELRQRKSGSDLIPERLADRQAFGIAVAEPTRSPPCQIS